MQQTKIRLNIKWLTGLLITFLCCVFYASLISFRTLPISEGWYTEYAWQINHGNLPYRDFEYLFFPLYIYLIAGFTRIFGYSILALRIFGVFIYGGIGIVLYCMFAKLFDNLSGVIAAVTASLYLQSEVGQMFYDYIRVHDLFAVTATYLLLCVSVQCFREKANETEHKNRIVGAFVAVLVPGLMAVSGVVGLVKYPLWHFSLLLVMFAGMTLLGIAACIGRLLLYRKKLSACIESGIPGTAVLCGIAVSMECMVKQSNGMLMIAMVLAYLLFCAVTLRSGRFLKALCGAFYGVIFSFSILAIYLLATDSVWSFFHCCFQSALGAKGGIMATLFQWIPTSWELFLQEKEKAAIIVMFVYIAVERCRRNKLSDRKDYGISGILLAGAAAAGLSWGCVYIQRLAECAAPRYNVNLPSLVFFLCTAAFAVYGVYLLGLALKKRQPSGPWEEIFPLFSVLGAVFAQGYGSGMSGGLAASQTAIGLGLLAALCMHTAFRARSKVLVTAACLVLLAANGTFVGRKTVQSYSWWSLNQDGIAAHTEYIDVPLLKGIRVREIDKKVYETVYQDVTAYTQPEDTIFAFPHCPIFYTMTDRHSLTYSKVQWFDVSSQESVSRDIEALRANPPRVLVYTTVPDAVYEAHQTLFSVGHTGSMRDFLFGEMIAQNPYEQLHEVDLGNGYFVSTYLLRK